MLYTSSSEVYGDCENIPQDENFLDLLGQLVQDHVAHGKRIAETFALIFKENIKWKLKLPGFSIPTTWLEV